MAPFTTECDFQNNLCGWTDGGSNFHFNRTDGQILTDLGIDGPNVDHTDSKDSKLTVCLFLTEEILYSITAVSDQGS